jgi:hypothetical protein
LKDALARGYRSAICYLAGENVVDTRGVFNALTSREKSRYDLLHQPLKQLTENERKAAFACLSFSITLYILLISTG